MTVRYIDPSYTIRSTPANTFDAESIPQAARGEIERLLASGDLFRYTHPGTAPVNRLEAENRVLRGEVGPEMASFYVLTPLPGTEQYDDFMHRGLIVERNLDRFDASCLTFRHPHLENEELQELVYRCYRRF